MPSTGTPRRKAANDTPRKAAAAKPVPDRSAMDAYEAQRTAGQRASDLERAQELVYDAWEAATRAACIRLAHKALAVSPLCADAYNILADHARTPTEARDLYALGLRAAERALGPEGFEEYGGRFWGYLETRPYMRSAAGLAGALMELGEEAAAVALYKSMLALNPGDNQGIRYLLHAHYLRRGDMKSLKALLASYKNEWSVYWLYTRALIGFRENKATAPATRTLLKNAWTVNAHVGPILGGTQPLTRSTDGYITIGGADEASEYVEECGAMWRETPGAIEWLLASRPSLSRGKAKRGETVH